MLCQPLLTQGSVGQAPLHTLDAARHASERKHETTQMTSCYAAPYTRLASLRRVNIRKWRIDYRGPKRCKCKLETMQGLCVKRQYVKRHARQHSSAIAHQPCTLDVSNGRSKSACAHSQSWHERFGTHKTYITDCPGSVYSTRRVPRPVKSHDVDQETTEWLANTRALFHYTLTA